MIGNPEWLKAEALKPGPRCTECAMAYDKELDGDDWNPELQVHVSCKEDQKYYEEFGD